jgi:hypothetical protein
MNPEAAERTPHAAFAVCACERLQATEYYPAPPEFAAMIRNVSILIGFMIVAVSLMFSLRWQVATTGAESGAVYRLDRWSGEITWCVPRADPPSNLNCEPK